MRYLNHIGGLVYLGVGLCLAPGVGRADLWCTAYYYPGWEPGAMPITNIDFTVVTHAVHFSLVPNADGTLDATANNITPASSANIVARAHAANRKALICVGGGGTSFSNAVNLHVSTLVNGLTNFIANYGYDGIDLDWEPLPDSEGGLFTNLVVKLRAAMNVINSNLLLTVAVPPAVNISVIAPVQQHFNQINVMTYDLSGPYGGWVTWFNAPIYDGGQTFPSTGGLVPSLEGFVSHFISNGIPAGKLGIGVAFYGYIWRGGTGVPSTGGVTGPRQSWTTAPEMEYLSYNTILSSNYPASNYHWDDIAKAAYVSDDQPGSANDRFLSYDDERACQSKVSYARNRGLGGVIIWELTQDYRTNQPAPLFQAVKQAFATPGAMMIQRAGTNVSLSFTSAPLGSYRVQWSSNLNTWSSLAVTNMTGTGGVIQVTEPAGSGSARRFYRVVTPP